MGLWAAVFEVRWLPSEPGQICFDSKPILNFLLILYIPQVGSMNEIFSVVLQGTD